ncbi:MAG: N-acetyltransferase family protein [Candidatus Thorarchaeota archaeon]|jgi:GNAT superfamily N-acetyltransferase
MSKEYTFRVPVKSDLPDILDIARTTWEGHDHLPEMFDSWLSDSSCYPYAIEIDGKIISLGNVRLIENGRTGWLEGLRVHHEFRNKGISRKMTEHLFEKSKELGAVRTRLTLAEDNPVPIILAKSIGMKPLLKLSAAWFATPDAMTFSSDRLIVEETTGVDLIDRDLQNTSLLPSNVLVYHWYALDHSPESLRILDSKVRFWIVETDSEIVGLSLGFRQSTPGGLEWCSTIYAKHQLAFLSLVSSQITAAKENECVSIMFLNNPEYSDILLSNTTLLERYHEIGLLLFEGPIA